MKTRIVQRHVTAPPEAVMAVLMNAPASSAYLEDARQEFHDGQFHVSAHPGLGATSP